MGVRQSAIGALTGDDRDDAEEELLFWHVLEVSLPVSVVTQ
jgi:hypothetical protein